MVTGQKHMAIANNQTQANQKELSIQISLSGLSFSTLNRTNNTVENLKHVDFDKQLTPFEVLDHLKYHFNTESFLSEHFNDVQLIHVNNLSTLVPKSLFNEEHLADYLKFNAKILKSDFITYDEIPTIDSVNVYVPYININNYIFEKFGAFTYRHYSSILIEEIVKLEKHNQDASIYVHIKKEHVEIIAIKNGKLLLYNSFQFSTKEDYIYYVLFTVEQLQLNPETINAVLLGDVEKGDKLYDITYKYIRHVTFGNRLDSYSYVNAPKSSYSDYTLIKSF